MHYIESLTPGEHKLTLWMLNWHIQAGNKGLVIQENAKNLIKLILALGFKTDPGLPGVEQLVVCSPNPMLFVNHPDMLDSPQLKLNRPGIQSIAFVKGWTRASAALVAASIIIEMDVKDMDYKYRRSFRTVHAIISDDYKNEVDRIDGNRGKPYSAHAENACAQTNMRTHRVHVGYMTASPYCAHAPDQMRKHLPSIEI